jgi:hypothetical protein
MKYESDGLEHCLRQFREAIDQTQEERETAERCRDYYDGKQWTDEEVQALERRGQPVIVSNRIAPKVNSLVGFEKRGRTDPKCYPRTPKHDAEADAATDALRFVCGQNRFQSIKSDVAENLIIEGCGAVTVTVVPDGSGDFDIKINQVPWDRFYRDPHSRMRDFSDAKYMGVVIWMDQAEIEERFPDAGDKVEAAYSYANEETGTTFEDRPKFQWADSGRKRVRVIQHYYVEKGQWHTAIICRGGYLREPQVSPYLDDKGQPECPLIAVSAYIDRENRRYGAVKTMLSSQDEINKRRSKALHRLTMRQVVAEDGAVENVAKGKAELAKPDGWLVKRPGAEFQLLDGSIPLQGELELLREAKAEIDASGVNPSLEGNLMAPSGRAQEVSQAAALSEQAIIFDGLRDWSLRVYRSVWNRIRQHWTGPKWVRITDDERNLRWVGLNKPVTRGEMLVKEAEQRGMTLTPEQMAQIQADPSMAEPVGVENEVASMDVDIIVDEGPDSVTVQSEQFESLVQLKQADPSSIPMEMVIEASSLRNKDRIMEHLKAGGIPPQVQAQLAEMGQALQAAQSQIGEAQLEAQRLQIDAQKVEVEAVKAEAAKLKAQADYIKAQADLLTAQQPQAMPTPQPSPMANVGEGIFTAIQAASAPKVKQGRMVRNPDGSYSFEIVEGVADAAPVQ